MRVEREFLMKKGKTDFLSAERSEIAILKSQMKQIESDELFNHIVNSFQKIILVINDKREIVYKNDAFAEILGIKTSEEIISLRPGEAVNCIHADEVNGCGTSKACQYCGALRAIMDVLKTKKPASRECSILSKDEEENPRSILLKVDATPIKISGNDFIMVSFTDISDSKRKERLERIFYHDILNTAGAINGLVEIIDMDEKPSPHVITLLKKSSKTLIEELLVQRQIFLAENNELEIRMEIVNTDDVIQDAISHVESMQISNDRLLMTCDENENIDFYSDKIILRRILINAIKNAVEASVDNDRITVCSYREEDNVIFSINNPKVMDEPTRLQVFKKSFSTKGKGRGIGTFSMKLLTEKYLSGTVSFESKEGEGTTFFISLPYIKQ